jgi:hypothetical protein
MGSYFSPLPPGHADFTLITEQTGGGGGCTLDWDSRLFTHLKVPKREIFDCSEFPDFYTIKVGDLVVKIVTYYFNF